MTFCAGYWLWLLAWSLAAFCVYAWDKRRARRGAWRVPERTLLLLSALGGAAGGCLAMRLCRHKTKKWYFHLVNGICLALQLGLGAFLLLRQAGLGR